jgi:hypothetical protein
VAAAPAAPAATAVPITRVLLGNLTVETEPHKIRVLSRGSPIIEFKPLKDGAGQWLAAIRNPYSPLQIANGSPFLENTKLKLPIADSIGSLVGPDGNFRTLTDKDLPRFPFFSSAATTIGFVLGENRSGGREGSVLLYFFDTASDAVATIPLPGLLFPEWLRNRGAPPPFLMRRTITLSSGSDAVSDVVVGSVQGYGNGRYTDDQVLRGIIAGEEFKKSLLTKDELAALKRTDFAHASAAGGPLYPAVQKIIRLLWYGKMLGRGDALAALAGQLHPATANAIRANSLLNQK